MRYGCLKRTCVRVVVLAHLMQIFTPTLGYASDTDYQYRLKIHTLNSASDQYRVEVSRRKKDKSGPVHIVQSIDLSQGQVKLDARTVPDGQEALYGKFANPTVKTFEAGNKLRFIYTIPGFGQVQMFKDDKAVFTQDEDNTSLVDYDLTVKSTGDLLLGCLKVAGLVLRSKKTELDGDIVTKSLRVKHSAENKGKISGDGLRLDVAGEMVNSGQVILKHLLGSGSFKNHRDFKFDVIYVRNFLNQTNSKTYRAQIFPAGGYSANIYSDSNQSFVNEADSVIVIKHLMFFGPKTTYRPVEDNKAVLTIVVRNLGVIKSDYMHFMDVILENDGSIEANTFNLERVRFNNRKNGVLLAGTSEVKESVIENDGEIKYEKRGWGRTKGEFTQDSGKFINNGLWNHNGDVNLGATELSNAGKLLWENGAFKFSTAKFENKAWWALDRMGYHLFSVTNSGTIQLKNTVFPAWPVNASAGILILDSVSCSKPLAYTNSGTLQLRNSVLEFSSLENKGTIQLFSGQYTVDLFDNKRLLCLLENDWTLTSDKKNTAPPHRLVVSKPNFGSKAEIESAKNLTYDMDAMPEKIRGQGDINFTQFSCAKRALADLRKVTSNGKVTWWTPSVSLLKADTGAAVAPASVSTGVKSNWYVFGGDATPFLQAIFNYSPDFMNNLDFSNIGHLHLNVSGSFTSHFSLKAPILTLYVRGPLILGKSNEQMGTIAATNGALTVHTQSIDGKFGMFYGFGPTTLEATKGDILIGAAAPTPGTAARASYTMNTQNGAYAASNDVLTLKTPTNILLDYGCLISNLQQNLFAATLIRNTAGRIAAGGPILMRGGDYLHTRGGMVVCGMDGSGYGWAYSGFVRECPLTGPASIESKSDITFDMNNVKNVASNILSGGHVYVGNKELVAGQTGAVLKEKPAGLPTRNNRRLWALLGTAAVNATPKTGSYTEEAYHMGPTATHDRGGRGKHWGNQWTEACAFLSAEGISINMGSFSITGATNSPLIQINVPGTGYFGNASNTRATVNSPVHDVVNVTEFILAQARRPGFMRIDHRGEVRNDFPMGMPFIPASGDVVILQSPDQAPLRKFPVNPAQFFNPICSIDLDLLLQEILRLRTGQVYAGNAKGNQLSRVLWGNAGNWSQKTGRAVMTEDELANTQESMLLMQPTDDNTRLDTVLVINPRDNNPFRSHGDTVARVLELSTGGNLDMVNNRLVITGEEDTVIQSGADINMTTTSHTNHYQKGDTRVVEQVADPQQMILKPNGKLTVMAKEDLNRTGSHVEAGGDLDLLAETGRLTENPLLLQRSAVTKRESNGLFSSSEHTETTLTHSAVPTTTISGAKLQKKAGAGIQLTAPQDSAEDKIIYDSPDTVIEGLMELNRQTSETTKSNGFTEQSTSMMQESVFGLPANLMAKGGVHFKGEAEVNANITTSKIHDETDSGIKFVPKVVAVKSSGQSNIDSPLLSVDAGFRASQETMLPCMIMAQEVIRSKEGGEMLFESVLMDDRTEITGKFLKTVRELEQWQTSWCHVKQVVPKEVIIAAAIAITILTKGAGAKILAPLLQGVTAATGMALSATGVVMVNAGFSAFCAAATSGFLRSGDPIEVAKQMVSLDQLKSIGISMASAGLCDKLGMMLKINMAPGIKELSMHLKEQALRGTVDTILNVSINQTPVDEALFDAVKQIPLKAVAAYAANQICCNINEPLGVTAAHTLVGGLSGFAMEGNRDGAVAGATGALAAQVVGDILMSDAHAIADTAIQNLREGGKPLTPENLQAAINAEVASKAELAKIAAVGVTALFKKNPNTALFTASNTLDNDITIRQSIYVMAELQKLLEAASLAKAAARVEEPVVKKAKPAKNKATKKQQRRKEAEDIMAMYLLEETRAKPHNDYQDVIFELCNEQIDAERKTSRPKITVMAAGSDFMYPVTEEISQEDFQARAELPARAARGIWRGGQDMVHGFVELVTQPHLYNNLIAPVGRALWDINVVCAGLNNRAGSYAVTHWDQPFSHDYYPDSGAYSESKNRLFNVWNGIKESSHAMYNANSGDQVEAFFRLATNLFTPWAVFKGIGLLPRTFAAADYLAEAPVVQGFSRDGAVMTDFVARTTNFQGRNPANMNRMPFVEGSAVGPWQHVNYSHVKVGGLWKDLTCIKNGTYYGAKDENLADIIKYAGSWTKKPEAPYLFLAHGDKEGIYLSKLKGYPVNKNPTALNTKNSMLYLIKEQSADHRIIAKLIEKDPKFNKDNLVVLFSCHGGGPTLPQHLANKLGAAVVAPEDVTWVLRGKKVAVAPIIKLGGVESANPARLQAFKTFYPGNKPAPSHPSVLWTPPEISAFDGTGIPLDALSKRLKAMRNNPKGDYQISDLQYIAFRYGIEYRQNSTSHVTFTYPNTRPVVVPSRKSIKPIYIKQFMEMLDDVIVKK